MTAFTQLSLPRRVLRTAGMGHGLPAPSTARRVRSGISERTVAETRSDREDALIPAIPGHVTMQTKDMHHNVFRHHGIAAGRLDLEERCIWQLWMVDKGLDPGRAAEHGFQIRKDREGIEVGMHKGEIFDIR